MRTKGLSYIIFFMLLILSSCSKERVPSTTTKVTYQPNIIEDGYVSKVDNLYHKYAVYLPDNYYSSESTPLIIFLHGAGGGRNPEDLTKKGPYRAINKGIKLDFVVASLLNPDIILHGREMVNLWNSEVINEFLEKEIKVLYKNIDIKRIYITGHSMGAGGTVRYAADYPEKVAAIVPISGGRLPEEKKCNLKEVPAWFFHSKDDIAVPISVSQNTVDLINSCLPTVIPKFTVFNKLGHGISYFIYDKSDEEIDIYSWMLQYSK
ncbi:phospholipase/carboxylesterase [Lutibacter sp. Hel_I_33_5]|uniref:carboxylesterase family protein n=1 Tax=Lutibacter sp. Hel_I_33_5 TaxID=1566289 RepID=UPI0011AC3C17|nr:alpha/beta fold hydrolase [Lutibacter sp. Hel_I_33_5]TVZ57171.1 phospholipase/carboxylesterase [Lutibacter sp. Hel_I_33_5]